MASTNPANRAFGNYVQFDNVHVVSGDSLTITVTPESPQATEIPAVNAIQLVQVLPVAPVPPSLTISKTGATLTIVWPDAAAGYVLESSPTLAPNSWNIVAGTPNPIAGAGSAPVTPNGNSYYRLRK